MNPSIIFWIKSLRGRAYWVWQQQQQQAFLNDFMRQIIHSSFVSFCDFSDSSLLWSRYILLSLLFNNYLASHFPSFLLLINQQIILSINW